MAQPITPVSPRIFFVDKDGFLTVDGKFYLDSLWNRTGGVNSTIPDFSVAANGILIKTATNVYTSRVLTGSADIGITDHDGVLGNPTFALLPTTVTAGTYTVNGSDFMTVDENGRVTSASSVTVTAVPSGSAGGALSGTYPNPSIAPITATGTTTARSLETRFSEILNVKDFGAVGDNSNDDTSAIQAAINRAAVLATTGNTRGAVVFFPPGLYKVTATLTISNSRIILKGSGKYQSYLERTTDYGPTVKVFTSPLSILEDIEIHDLGFAHDDTTHSMADAHIVMAGVTHAEIRNVEITHGAYGIKIYGCVDLTIDNCSLAGFSNTVTNPNYNGTGGIVFYDLSEFDTSSGMVTLPTQIMMKDTEILGPLNTGYAYACIINGCEQLTISNCYLGNSKYVNLLIEQKSNNKAILEVTVCNGTYIDGAGNYSVSITGSTGNGSAYIGNTKFVGCNIKGQGGQTTSGIIVDDTARGGTYSQACVNLQVIGCTISGYNQDGLSLYGGVGTVVSGNKICGNNYNNSTGGRGILLGASASRTLIVGNQIGSLSEGIGTSLQPYGIEILSGATEYQIFNNDTEHNTTAGISYNSVVLTTLAAAGTNQSTATLLTLAYTTQIVSTVAAGTGVRFPSAFSDSHLTLINAGANDLLVYPVSGGTINGLAANAAYTLKTGSSTTFIATATNAWRTYPMMLNGDVNNSTSSSALTISSSLSSTISDKASLTASQTISGRTKLTTPCLAGDTSASDADTTFTDSSNRIIVSNITTARTYTLPTTSIVAGEIWTIYNRGTSILTVNASGGSTILTMTNGKAMLCALQATPTTPAHWQILERPPIFISVSRGSSNQTGMTLGSDFKINLNNKNEDRYSAFDEVTNFRFTVPTGGAGLYTIAGSVFLTAPASTSTIMDAIIYKNGGLYYRNRETINFVTAIQSPPFVQTIRLADADYLEFYANIGGTGTGAAVLNDTTAQITVIRVAS